jgi:hypothetical protein
VGAILQIGGSSDLETVRPEGSFLRAVFFSVFWMRSACVSAAFAAAFTRTFATTTSTWIRRATATTTTARIRRRGAAATTRRR